MLANVKKNVFILQASRRHDQDSWCRIFCDYNTSTKLLGKNKLRWLYCLCYIFLCMRPFCLLVSLFYGKYYVTMFIREFVAFSYRYWGKFLLKMRRNCLESFFFPHRKRFYFSFFLRFSNRFFLSVSFRFILFFFLVRQWLDGFCWFYDLLFFHSYEKT